MDQPVCHRTVVDYTDLNAVIVFPSNRPCGRSGLAGWVQMPSPRCRRPVFGDQPEQYVGSGRDREGPEPRYLDANLRVFCQLDLGCVEKLGTGCIGLRGAEHHAGSGLRLAPHRPRAGCENREQCCRDECLQHEATMTWSRA